MELGGWYTAEIVVEITVEGDPRTVFHRNLILVWAPSPEGAYQKALEFGARENITYPNPAGRQVRSRFLGLAELEYTYEEPGDGAEIAFQEQIGLPRARAARLVKPKARLRAFLPPRPTAGPDYSSGEVMEAAGRLRGKGSSGD
jgi:hypothetical protein